MNTLWYKSPARNWNEALPLGNGRLGAMLCGTPGHETISLSEESLWSGGYTCRDNKAAAGSVRQIRELLNQQRAGEAQELLLETFSAIPESQTFMRSAGELHLDFYTSETFALTDRSARRADPFEGYTSYRRELDLRTAIATTSFSKDMNVQNTAYLSRHSQGSSITFTREAFVDAATDVLVLHFTASTPKSIYFRANFERGTCSSKSTSSDDTIILTDTSGVTFAAMATGVVSGGRIFTRGEYLVVEEADEALLFVDVQTAFRKHNYRARGGNIAKRPSALASWCCDRALKNICFALGAEYQNLKKTHIEEYSHLYDTVSLEMQGQGESLSTDELVSSCACREKLTELYWNFSRYLYISAGRVPGTLPATTSLWNPQGKEGLRFNLCSPLSYDMLPSMLTGTYRTDHKMSKYLKRLLKNGRRTALSMFKADGFAAFTTTDLWGDTAPDGKDIAASFTPLGSAYIARSISEFYDYTQDRKFLKKHFKILEAASDFFAHYLADSGDGGHVCLSPSAKEEGYALTDGTTAYVCSHNPRDSVIIAALFKATLDCAKILGKDLSDANLVKYSALLKKLDAGSPAEESPATDITAGLPANLMGNNFENVSAITSAIISSRMEDGRVCIKVLSSAPQTWRQGSIKSVPLKGNILADVSWSNGTIDAARVYSKPGTTFLRELTIEYLGKRYETRLTENPLDLLNVLPSTV
ncbi:MAG: glycoside hydrolase N-terminal domain-containing protein [Treponema sp.]|nr:glycoside hydrolase N-terminal domain-containing protein [Treponema sp.]